MRNVSLAVRKRHKKERLQTAPLVLLSHLLNQRNALTRRHLLYFRAHSTTDFWRSRRYIKCVEVQAAHLAAVDVTAANHLTENLYFVLDRKSVV